MDLDALPVLDHVDFAVRDLAASRAFYTTVLAPLNVVPIIDIKRDDGREGTGFGRDGVASFWIGGGAPVAGRLHVAFAAATRAEVDAFHTAGLALGSRNHGAPGVRPQYGEPYYAAYLLDPDGHVVEAVCRTTR